MNAQFAHSTSSRSWRGILLTNMILIIIVIIIIIIISKISKKSVINTCEKKPEQTADVNVTLQLKPPQFLSSVTFSIINNKISWLPDSSEIHDSPEDWEPYRLLEIRLSLHNYIHSTTVIGSAQYMTIIKNDNRIPKDHAFQRQSANHRCNQQ